MHIQAIRNLVPFEEIDYLFLSGTLKDYAQPRNKIKAFIAHKDLIRVKKDVMPFISEKENLDIWSISFFKEIISNVKGIGFVA